MAALAERSDYRGDEPATKRTTWFEKYGNIAVASAIAICGGIGFYTAHMVGISTLGSRLDVTTNQVVAASTELKLVHEAEIVDRANIRSATEAHNRTAAHVVQIDLVLAKVAETLASLDKAVALLNAKLERPERGKQVD